MDKSLTADLDVMRNECRVLADAADLFTSRTGRQLSDIDDAATGWVGSSQSALAALSGRWTANLSSIHKSVRSHVDSLGTAHATYSATEAHTSEAIASAPGDRSALNLGID